MLYPGALPGLLVAGDPGIPKTLAPTSYRNFAPRVGFAYSPRFEQGVWKDDLRRRRQEQHSSKLRPLLHRIPGLAGRHYVLRAALWV